MSSIHGKGYGDKHQWEDKGTDQMPIAEDRSTLWICKKCGISFRHFYHIIPDIFEMMKYRNIKEECEE